MSDAVGSSRISSRALRAEGARDLDELLFGQAQRGGLAVHVDVARRRAPAASRARSRRDRPVDARQRAGRFQPEREVLGDGEIREQRRMLMDGDDAQSIAPTVGLKTVDGLPVERRPRRQSGVSRAGEDADQRGLARAVFADQRVDLARAHLERGVGKRADAGEVLGQVFNDEHVRPRRAYRLAMADLKVGPTCEMADLKVRPTCEMADLKVRPTREPDM